MISSHINKDTNDHSDLPCLINTNNTQIYTHNSFNQITIKNINNFKIIYINARSLNNKILEIQNIIQNLNTKIDVIMITETWMKPNQEKFFKFNNFNTVFANRENRIGGGACILINDTHNFDKVKSFCDDHDSIIIINMNMKNKKQTLINVYRPPYTEQERVNSFFEKLDNILSSCNGDTIVTGDFNFNLIKENQNTNKYTEIICLNNFCICNSSIPTRDITNSCLDHLIVNNYTRRTHTYSQHRYK